MNKIAQSMKDFVTFLKESWHEVRHKVTWPPWNEVKGTTLVVLATTLVFAVYLGTLDFVMVTIVDKFFSLFT